MTHTKPLEIVLLGDPGTGKTNLLSRFTSNHFNPDYEPTNGINFDHHTLLVGDQRMEMDLLDLAGHNKWCHLTERHLHNADGILLVYDISNPATFENLAAWLRLIHQTASPKTVIKLVGNKNDLHNRMVSIKEAEQFATDNGLTYIETSALHDNNVHLAFEILAQEINVGMHSVSEPSKVSSNDDQQDKPFQVVLIDIEQAARHESIVCVEKPLDEANLEFIAISYRWGEVEEELIDTKVGYMARVTSFGLKDFYLLCRDMMKETDLQSIKYVWVDAICVDQNNHARRKATIYQMSNIYHRAAYILAVPDLHLEYLVNTNIFDRERYQDIHSLSEFFYYLVHGKSDQLAQVKEKWFDEMGIPKGMARKDLTQMYANRFSDYLLAYNVQASDSPCDDTCQHNCFNSDYLDSYSPNRLYCQNTPHSMHQFIQEAINWCHDHPESTTLVHENTDCALCLVQMDICKHQEKCRKNDNRVCIDCLREMGICKRHEKSNNKNQVIAGPDDPWLACVLKEFRYEKYRNLVKERSIALGDFMGYLGNLIVDWSSRVWVISECNIAKAKHYRKMKFWFLSLRTNFSESYGYLRNTFYDADQDLHADFWEGDENLEFFVFDFAKTEADDLFTEPSHLMDLVSAQAELSYERIQTTLMSRLSHQSFLEMMLGSKASRNEDRFYAVFPSSEYKDKLTSREMVSSWEIDTILSVKLKLYELMTTKHKLELLYLTARGIYKPTCIFPTFASINVAQWSMKSCSDEPYELNSPCNFDLNNNASLRLVSMDNENGIHFYKLNLSPKMYYAIRDGTGHVKKGYDTIFNENKKLWETLKVNYDDDELVYVYIPMYTGKVDLEATRFDEIEHIALFGSFKKSKWLICKNIFSGLVYRYSIEVSSWVCYDNSDGNISFDIY